MATDVQRLSASWFKDLAENKEFGNDLNFTSIQFGKNMIAYSIYKEPSSAKRPLSPKPPNDEKIWPLSDDAFADIPSNNMFHHLMGSKMKYFRKKYGAMRFTGRTYKDEEGKDQPEKIPVSERKKTKSPKRRKKRKISAKTNDDDAEEGGVDNNEMKSAIGTQRNRRRTKKKENQQYEVEYGRKGSERKEQQRKPKVKGNIIPRPKTKSKRRTKKKTKDSIKKAEEETGDGGINENAEQERNVSGISTNTNDKEMNKKGIFCIYISVIQI